MSIFVALHHVTHYRYDRPVDLGPQIIRLRPAPHTRTPILSYSLKVTPANHFVNWQQDPHGNWLARFVFPEKATRVQDRGRPHGRDGGGQSVRLLRRALCRPASRSPIPNELKTELAPYLATWSRRRRCSPPISTRDAARGRQHRQFPGRPQRAPAARKSATWCAWSRACRRRRRRWRRLAARAATAPGCWCRSLRHLGLAARFVSGYLIQLKPDIEPLDGPREVETDFTDLHAWAEVYLPGAGWIGFDATSGLLAGEGHIPLAATPHYRSAAPITGSVGRRRSSSSSR